MPSTTDCGSASASTFSPTASAVVGSTALRIASCRRSVSVHFASSPKVSKRKICRPCATSAACWAAPSSSPPPQAATSAPRMATIGSATPRVTPRRGAPAVARSVRLFIVVSWRGGARADHSMQRRRATFLGDQPAGGEAQQHRVIEDVVQYRLSTRKPPPMSPLPRPVSLLLNVAHALDHLFLLVFATAVSTIAIEFGFTRWEDLMPFSVGAFLMFGLGSMPAGRLGDLWGRRQMMLVFFFGMGASAILVALTQGPWSIALALALLGTFASVYHPVGIPMLVQHAKSPGATIGINGLAGNLGIAAAALLTAF